MPILIAPATPLRTHFEVSEWLTLHLHIVELLYKVSPVGLPKRGLVDDTASRQSADRHPIRRWLLRILLCVVAFVLSFAVTAAALIYSDLSGRVNNFEAPAMAGRTPPDSYDGLPINVLIIGSDTRAGQQNIEGSVEGDTSARSDTTMVAHISADRKSVNVVSIPRDLIVDIPSCERKDGSVSQPQRAQFNWAFSIGGEGGDLSSAVYCTWKTVEELSGIRIDESVVVDFNGFAAMIDALGGINMYVPYAVHDYEYSKLFLDPGCQHFDGEKALAYARVRHGVEGSDGSDLRRIERQQAVMSVMLHTALNKNILTSVSELYRFVGNGLSSLTISEGLSSVAQLVGLGWSLQSINPENLRFVTLPVAPAPEDINRVVLDGNGADDIWESFKNDSPLPPGTEVRDGNGSVYEIPDPSVQPIQPSDSPAAESAEGAEPAAEAPVEPAPAETAPGLQNDELTPAELARLQRECELSGR